MGVNVTISLFVGAKIYGTLGNVHLKCMKSRIVRCIVQPKLIVWSTHTHTTWWANDETSNDHWQMQIAETIRDQWTCVTPWRHVRWPRLDLFRANSSKFVELFDFFWSEIDFDREARKIDVPRVFGRVFTNFFPFRVSWSVAKRSNRRPP